MNYKTLISGIVEASQLASRSFFYGLRSWPLIWRPSTRDFKGPVGNGEHAHDPSPLLGANVKVFLNMRARNEDADAIEVGNRRQKEQKRAHSVARFDD